MGTTSRFQVLRANSVGAFLNGTNGTLWAIPTKHVEITAQEKRKNEDRIGRNDCGK